MTAVDTLTHPEHTTTSEDNLSHRFCRGQAQAWLEGEPATARCGKTKHDWEPATGDDMLCIICWHYWKTQQCAHCNQQNRGRN